MSAIASVLLLYAPISRSTHSALSLLCLGLLVAPVSNLPTSPMNVLQAATFSLTVVLAGWLFKSGGCSATICGVDFRPVFQCFVTTTGADPLSWEQGAHGTDIKLDRRGDAIQNGVGKRGNVRNAPGSASSSIYNTLRTGQLPQSEIAIQVGAIEDDDLEMTTSSHSLQPQMTNTPQEFAAENDSGGSFQDETFSIHQSMLFGALLALRSRKLRMPLCGMVLGMTGLLCFALQGRDTYYFLHSLWHFLMMISAYLLVHGRIELLDL